MANSLAIRDALARCPALAEIVRDFHWMARRYADNRQSYATSMFNEYTAHLIRAGLMLNPCGDDGLWARDQMGAQYEGVLRCDQDALTAINAQRRKEELPDA